MVKYMLIFGKKLQIYFDYIDIQKEAILWHQVNYLS